MFKTVVKQIVYKITSCKVSFYKLFLVLTLFPATILSQTVPVQHLTMRNGLPSMSIRSIYKDSRGLLWIGTDAGLCTFDGKSFRIFKSSEGMTASQVWAVTEDESGNMWLGSFGEGIYKYDGKTFRQFTTKNGLVENTIRVMAWSKKYDCLVAAGYEGISVISGDSVKSVKAGDLGPRSRRYAFTGVIDQGEFLYITNYHANTLIRFYPDKMEGKIVNASDTIYPAYSLSGLIKSEGDTVFTNNEQGIRIIKGRKATDVNCTGQIFGMSEDKHRNIWFTVWSYPGRNFDSGIYKYDGKTLKNYKNALGITDKEIWTVYCDKEQDVVWVGTLNEGLFKISNSGIEKFPPSYFNLDRNFVADLFIDSKDILWISGSNELISMDSLRNYYTIPKATMIKGYKQFWNNHNLNNFYPGGNPGIDELQILNTHVSKINEIARQFTFTFNRVIEDDNNSVYFTNKLGLYKITKNQTDVKFLGYIGNNFDIDFFGNDTLLSTRWGPTFITPRINNINSIFPDNESFYLIEKTDSVVRGRPFDVNRLAKKGSQFWYATMFSGLWMSEKMQLVHFNKTDSTIGNSLNDICFDEHGNVIFGSNTGEICIAIYQNDSLKINHRITNENGLIGNSITWLVADQKGKLWAGTNLGLNCIDLDSLVQSGKYVIRFMDEEEGYTGHSAKRAVLDKTGNLWMGAGDQLIKLNTSDFLTSHSNKGKVILKSIEINNSRIDSTLKSKLDPWSWMPTGEINLPHNQNNLIFYFDVFELLPLTDTL